MEFKDQLVLVTGSARSIGASIAKAFHREGATVIINYLDAESDAFKLASSLKAMAVKADVTDKQQIEELFRNAEAYHGRPITTIVNNTLSNFGVEDHDARPKLDQKTSDDMQTYFDDAKGAVSNTSKAALPGFEKLGKGCIINVGYNLTSDPRDPYQDSNTAKGTLLSYTRSLATEFGSKDIQVNMVSSHLLAVTLAIQETQAEDLKQVESVVPLSKASTQEELADAVVLFASPLARAITGQNVNVNAGPLIS